MARGLGVVRMVRQGFLLLPEQAAFAQQVLAGSIAGRQSAQQPRFDRWGVGRRRSLS
jgi:hypothetical protein